MENYDRGIKEILKNTVELSKTVETIDINDNLYDFGLDSITCVSLALEIEKQFNITINDEDITEENFLSIANLIRMLKENYL